MVLVAWGGAPSPAPGLPRIHAFGDARYDAGQWLPLVTQARALPLRGRPAQRPWNAYWWPYNAGGLNHRWLSPHELSPIEKLDAVSGHAAHEASRWEAASHPSNVPWGGQCDGYATAAIMEPEPRFPVLDQGVCFASGDVKGLLGAIYMGDMSGQRVDVLGRDVVQDDRRADDLDPATFHLALTNVMGLHHRGLYLDVGKHGEIYNKVVASYVSRVRRRGRRLWVTTTLQIVTYRLAPAIASTPGALHVAPKTLRYQLALDGAGAIVPGRGAWLGHSVRNHPTAMKIPRGTAVRTGVSDPFIDVARVERLAARSAAASRAECWP